ncbi:hypothetical protein LCGC14_0392220 [marine sediment metagenome]|uniref:AAA domain-containing protein n=1 Tax=marine sediment metagenome TaxID=412755 RepID=A0A0F9W8B8_9ZZZZ
MKKISLPKKLSKVSDDINDYLILIHGEKKIGKTTLALQEPGVLLLTFDPPQKALRVLQRHVGTWPALTKYVGLLMKEAKKKDFPYKRIVIDGVDIAYRLCQDYVCAKLGVEHPRDEAYGKGWDMLKHEFAKYIDKVLALPCGVWFICHSRWQEVETRSGPKVSKLVPLLKSGAEEIVAGKVDGWFAYDYIGTQRILIIQGDERTGAGHRMSEHAKHFQTPEGKRVKEIPMGSSPKEAYRNLLSAFDNKQEHTKVKRKEGGKSKRFKRKGKLRMKKDK